MIVLSLVQNIALLTMLIVMHQVFAKRKTVAFFDVHPLVSLVLSGCAFGAVGIVGMLTPVHLAPGVFFDGRSIILAVTGLFGGPVVALVAAVLCAACRLWLGGAGALMGVGVICESAALGVVFHYWRKRNPRLMGYLPLLGFGLLVHVAMMGLMLFLPAENRWEAIGYIGLPVLLLYSVATMIICRLFVDQESRAKNETAVLQSETKYRELVELANSIILRWDASGKITFCNEFGLRFFGYSRDELIGQNAVGTIVPPTDTAGQDLSKMVLDIHSHPELYETNQNENMRKDGTRVWVAWTNRPILDDRGQCVELLAVGNDITDLRRAEDALRESNQLFSLFMQYSPVYVFMKSVTPTESRVLQASENFWEMTGTPGHEMIGKTMEELFPPEFAAKITADDWSVVSSGEVLKINEDLKGRNYTTIKFPIALEDRTLLAGYTIDITERTQAEQALLLAHQRLQQFVDSNIVGVMISNFAGSVIEANDYYLNLIGFTRDEFKTGMVDWRRVTPSDWLAVDERVICELRKRGTCLPYEKEYVRRDGSRVPVLLTAAMLPGPDECIAAFILDLTERKEAEEKYHTLFHEMLDAFALHEIVCDAAGKPVDYRFLAVNPAFERMTGLVAGEIVGHTVLDVMPATERHWIETYGRVALTGEPAFFENYSAELGRHFEVKAFRSAPGRFVCIFADITARRQAEEERAVLEAELQQAQKMESVGRLAGGVAHDFNNMLAVILGYTEVALGQVDPTQPLRADLEEIHNAAARSADLTRQLLAFARRQTVVPKVLDLNETVAGLLKMLQRLIGENIHLDWNPGANLWLIRMDPSQIDQVLANLCVNARDAIADVGRVTIETENRIIDVNYRSGHSGPVPGEYVLLTVSDDGCGMNDEMLAHIFEPFFTTKEMGKGTGLGLATLYGIVKQNGGFIEVRSTLGNGTVFEIYLPRHAGNVRLTQTEGPAVPPIRGHETILLVEDEPAFLKLATTMLIRQGYTVVAAGTPGEALRLAREHRGNIHLLMTDVIMPEMNGRDLAKRLLSFYPQVKRLFMSGYTADVIAHQGVLEEGTAFIQKPFSMADLAAKVREALDTI